MRKKLTTKTIDALPPAKSKRYEVRDTVLPGLHVRVSATGIKLPLEAYEFANVVDEPRDASLGVRPEQVKTGEAAMSMPLKTETVVELVEPMGSDTLVWARMADQQFRFRMEGLASVQTGDRLTIGFDPAQTSLFDARSEMRL